MRAWGLEDTRDRQAGQEGGGPEGSIAPLRARQELLGITLKALQTSPLLDPEGLRPLGRQLKQELVTQAPSGRFFFFDTEWRGVGLGCGVPILVRHLFFIFSGLPGTHWPFGDP